MLSKTKGVGFTAGSVALPLSNEKTPVQIPCTNSTFYNLNPILIYKNIFILAKVDKGPD